LRDLKDRTLMKADHVVEVVAGVATAAGKSRRIWTWRTPGVSRPMLRDRALTDTATRLLATVNCTG
jgi:hypothetical protein